MNAHLQPTGSAYFLTNETQEIERHTLSVLVDNEPGILARVVGLFSARGYNIESLTVSETEHGRRLSRITTCPGPALSALRGQCLTPAPAASPSTRVPMSAIFGAPTCLNWMRCCAPTIRRPSSISKDIRIEGYPSPEFIALINKVSPQQVTLVPGSPEPTTSDHGWDFHGKSPYLSSVAQLLKAPGRRISLFCDPEAGSAEVIAAQGLGPAGLSCMSASMAAVTRTLTRPNTNWRRLRGRRTRWGWGINAGHDLTLANLPAFQAAVPGVAEVSIGHGITADALLMGFAAAVAAYRAILGD